MKPSEESTKEKWLPQRSQISHRLAGFAVCPTYILCLCSQYKCIASAWAGQKYPELPEFVPLVLNVCQSFYCDHLCRDLSLFSNTWLWAKNWHTRKQIWFKDILNLQDRAEPLSGFTALFSTAGLRGSLVIWVSRWYPGEGLRIALSQDPICLQEMLDFSTRPWVCSFSKFTGPIVTLHAIRKQCCCCITVHFVLEIPDTPCLWPHEGSGLVFL